MRTISVKSGTIVRESIKNRHSQATSKWLFKNLTKTIARQQLPTCDILLCSRATNSTRTAAELVDTMVVDKHGVPMTVYHGTAAAFTRFGENPRGIFFAEDIAQAAPFSRIRSGTPRVIAANLSIKNPWQMVRYADNVPYSQMIDQSVGALRARGYDGIYAPDDKVWIVFDASQIHQLEAETDDLVNDATEALLEAPGHG